MLVQEMDYHRAAVSGVAELVYNEIKKVVSDDKKSK